jgi:response regulator RpfG family c-di-GMP phosphodiesterase
MTTMTVETRNETILIVDDEEPVRRPLRKVLVRKGYACLEADCADKAIETLSNNSVDLAILDVMMPHKSGLELLPEIKVQHPDMAIVMATAVIEPETIIECMREGARDYITKPYDLEKFTQRVGLILQKRQFELTVKRFQESLKGKVEEQATEIRRMYIGAIESLIFALESKDKYTAGHSRRVSEFTLTIARHMGIPDEELADIRSGALLHDVGKIAVDPDIQNKPGKLTEEEYAHIMIHTQVGPSIVKPIANNNILDMIRYHHTRFDGQAKGQTMSGAQLPLAVRIITLADSFDAMTSKRPYRDAFPMEKAVTEILRCSGTQFDPQVVEAFMKIPESEIQSIIKQE